MKDKKIDWLKPMLVELEKATYTLGVCSTGPSVTGTGLECTNGGVPTGVCISGGVPTGMCYKGPSIST